jgi:hypothetical protein
MKMFKYILSVALITIASSSYGQDSVSTSIDSQSVAPMLLVPAKTTLAEAIQFWQERGMLILGRGHLALGSGSGVDNASEAFDKDVDLIDVDGVDFEGISLARFLFFKGSLYGIQSKLTSPLFKDKQVQRLNFNSEKLDELRKNLLKKYGKPQETSRTFMATGKKPDVFVWHLNGNRLVFSFGEAGASLVLMNQKIANAVEAHRKEVCKSFNTKERRICW